MAVRQICARNGFETGRIGLRARCQMMAVQAIQWPGGVRFGEGQSPSPIQPSRNEPARRYSFTFSRCAISPTSPRRKASTTATKIPPWMTVTQAPISAR
jgi:hypothetical protein